MLYSLYKHTLKDRHNFAGPDVMCNRLHNQVGKGITGSNRLEGLLGH